MLKNAKLLWSRMGGVDLAVVRRKIAFYLGRSCLMPERVTVILPEQEVSIIVVAAIMG